MSFESIKNYLDHARWNRVPFWKGDHAFEHGEIFYTFNPLEEFGNGCLAVAQDLFKKGSDIAQECPLFYVVFAVMGVVATIFGLLGFVFKTTGEYFNPMSKKRYEVLQSHRVVVPRKVALYDVRTKGDALRLKLSALRDSPSQEREALNSAIRVNEGLE